MLFFLKDNKKEFILWLNVPKVTAYVILRDYLLQGYSVNRHLIALQENMDKRMTHIEDVQAKQQQQLDFFIRTSTPPAEMVFFEGDFYTARVALENLIRTANHRVIASPPISGRDAGSLLDGIRRFQRLAALL